MLTSRPHLCPSLGDDETVADLKSRVEHYDVPAWWALNDQVQTPIRLQALQHSLAATIDPDNVSMGANTTATHLHNPYAGVSVSQFLDLICPPPRHLNHPVLRISIALSPPTGELSLPPTSPLQPRPPLQRGNVVENLRSRFFNELFCDKNERKQASGLEPVLTAAACSPALPSAPQFAWQLTETVDEFLARLPPSRTPQSPGTPWIYICNPFVARSGRQAFSDGQRREGEEEEEEEEEKVRGGEDEAPVEPGADLRTFCRGGMERLHLASAFVDQCRRSGMADVPVARECRKAGDDAAAEILDLAHALGVRCGKVSQVGFQLSLSATARPARFRAAVVTPSMTFTLSIYLYLSSVLLTPSRHKCNTLHTFFFLPS